MLPSVGYFGAPRACFDELTMTSPGDLKAKANELYDFAQAIDDDDDRLPYVMRAMELEIQAIVLEQQGTVPQRDGP